MTRDRQRFQLLLLAHGEDSASPGEVTASPPSGGMALIEMRGVMTESPIEGFLNRALHGSTVGTWTELRQVLRAADELVGAEGVVVIDGNGPGSTAMGTDTTMATLAGLKAKTAFWNSGRALSGFGFLATASDVVAGSPVSEWGSLQTRLRILDTREAEKAEGVKVIDIVPDGAELKGEISPELLAHFKARATETAAVLARFVGEGRDLSPSKVKALMDGRTMGQLEAVGAGLVDETHPTREAFLASLQTKNTEEATMAPKPNEAAAPTPAAASTEPATVATPPQPATPPTPPTPGLEAMLEKALEGISTLTGTVKDLSNTVAGLATHAQKSDDQVLRDRIEAANAPNADLEMEVSKALSPDLREKHLAQLETTGRAHADFEAHMGTVFDGQDEEGNVIKIRRDGGLKGADPSDVDQEDARLHAMASASAAKDHKEGSKEYDAAYESFCSEHERREVSA